MSVIKQEENGIYILTIDREKALNALNVEVMDALHSLFVENGPHPGEVKGVVITGAGKKAFAAGADISEFPTMDSSDGIGLAEKGHTIFNAIEDCPVPVVAAVNGFALGGGCELAMACHLRLASPNAKFGQPEVKLGLIPGYGGTQRLVRLIGSSKAMELLLTGDVIDADQAEKLGLVNKVVDSDDLMSAAKEMVQKIGNMAPLAIEKTIASVNAGLRNPAQGFRKEIELFGASFDTDDAKEGVRAFMEKRRPNFEAK